MNATESEAYLIFQLHSELRRMDGQMEGMRGRWKLGHGFRHCAGSCACLCLY